MAGLPLAGLCSCMLGDLVGLVHSRFRLAVKFEARQPDLNRIVLSGFLGLVIGSATSSAESPDIIANSRSLELDRCLCRSCLLIDYMICK